MTQLQEQELTQLLKQTETFTKLSSSHSTV